MSAKVRRRGGDALTGAGSGDCKFVKMEASDESRGSTRPIHAQYRDETSTEMLVVCRSGRT
jgi:hypothetical protein